MDIRHIDIDWTPELERPVLIAGFTGWNDAADAASVAVGALASSWEARRFGGFDGEEFFDFQTTRPQVKLVDGVTREIQWPENMLSATEPRLQAAGGRGRLANGTGAELPVAGFLHGGRRAGQSVERGTRGYDGSPARRRAAFASRLGLRQLPGRLPGRILGLSASRYEGPTGITGVLHRACADGGLPSVSFWASVPHYLPAVPSAPAALALWTSSRACSAWR